MTKSWISCKSHSHDGETLHLNLDRVEMMYRSEDRTIIVMAGWDPEDVLEVEETPEALLAQTKG